MWLWLVVHLRADNTVCSWTEEDKSQILFWVSVTESLNCSQIWKQPDGFNKEDREKKTEKLV